MSKSIFNTAIFNSKNITNSNSVNAVTTDLIIAENMEVTGTLTNAEVQANSLKVGITTTQADAITTNTNKTGISTSQTSAITANTLKLSAITYNTIDDVTEFSESVKIDSDKNLFIGSKNIGSSLTTVENSLGDKQDKITDALNAGDNISITSDGVIDSTDTNTTYTAKSEGGLALSGTQFSLDLTNISVDSTYAFPRDVFVDSSKKLRAGALEYYKDGAVKDVNTQIGNKQDTLTNTLNAGDNISITSDGVIDSTDTNTTYTAKSEGGLALSGTQFSLDLTNIASDSTYAFPRDVFVDSSKKLRAGALEYYKDGAVKDVKTQIGNKQDTLTNTLNAGDNISITSDGVISSSHTNTNTTYTAKSEGGLALSGTQFSLDLTNIASDSTYAFPRDVFVDSSKKLRAGALEYYKSSALKDVSTEIDKKADLFVIDSASRSQLAFSTDTGDLGVPYKTLEVTLASGITNADYGLVTSDVVFDSIKTKADDFIINPSNTTSQMRFINYTDTGTGAVSKSIQLIMASSIANSNYGLVTSDQVFDGLALKEDSFVVNSGSSNQLEFVNEGTAKTLKVKLATSIADADGGLVTSDLAQSNLVTIGTSGTNDNQTIYGNKRFDDILEYSPRIMRFYYAIESAGDTHVRSGSSDGVWGNGSYLTSVSSVTNNTSFAENTATASDRAIKITADGYYRIRVSVNYFSPIFDGRMSLRVYLYNRSTGTSYSTNRAYNFFALGSTSLRACVGTSIVFEDYAGFTSGTQLQVRHDLNTSVGGNGRGYSDTFSNEDTDNILMYQNVTIEKIN